MAITTGAQLAAAVKAEIARVDLDSRIPDFVSQAEAALFRVLRTPEMETKDATFSITANEYVAVPTGFLEARTFQPNGYAPLKYLPPDSMQAVQVASGSGVPRYYSVVGTNFRFSPIADASYPSTLVYWKAPTTVSTGSTEQNWLLTQNQDIYMAGALMFASRAAKDWDAADRYQQQFATFIGQLVAQGQKMRWGGNSMTQRVA